MKRPLALALTFLTAAVAAPISTGCGALACDEIGCANGLTLDATAAAASGAAATVRIFDDGTLISTWDCGAVGDCSPTEDVPGAVERVADGELRLDLLDIAGTTVRVEMEIEGQTYAGEVMPAWEDLRPNGTGCPPVCRIAPEESITLAAE